MQTKMFRSLLVMSLSLVLAIFLASCNGQPAAGTDQTGAYASPAPENGKTLANLMEAYNGESNANAKYLEYAKKADAEGYGKVASLFRAAATAEGP